MIFNISLVLRLNVNILKTFGKKLLDLNTIKYKLWFLHTSGTVINLKVISLKQAFTSL